jgi:hypothetical protein
LTTQILDPFNPLIYQSFFFSIAISTRIMTPQTMAMMTYQAAEKRPSVALSGRLTVSAAWQEVAPYSSRRHPSSFTPQVSLS